MANVLQYFRKDDRGSLSVEAALLAPFLISILIGVADTSFMLVQNHKIKNRLAVGASFLASSYSPELQEIEAKRLATTGRPGSGYNNLITGWDSNQISITYREISNSDENGDALYRGEDTIQVVRLATDYTYAGFGLLKAINGGNVTISIASEERVVGSVTG